MKKATVNIQLEPEESKLLEAAFSSFPAHTTTKTQIARAALLLGLSKLHEINFFPAEVSSKNCKNEKATKVKQ